PGIIRKRVGETLLDDAAQQVEHLAERVDIGGEIAVVARAVVLGQQPPQLAAARRCGSGRHGLASYARPSVCGLAGSRNRTASESDRIRLAVGSSSSTQRDVDTPGTFSTTA